jgi:F0F1-type ATP synthase membrane subunit c/vacuolar-type H+-ATPase subunit K
MNQAVATGARILTVLWLAFLAAVGLYAVVLFFLRSNTEAAPVPGVEMLRQVFLAVGATLAVGSLWWRRRFSRAAAEGAGIGAAEVPENAIGEAMRHCVVAWAMAEAIAVLGLVLAILSREVDDFLPFAAAAVVVLYLNRPAVWPIVSGRGGPH